jgi:hypothetical protein
MTPLLDEGTFFLKSHVGVVVEAVAPHGAYCPVSLSPCSRTSQGLWWGLFSKHQICHNLSKHTKEVFFFFFFFTACPQ